MEHIWKDEIDATLMEQVKEIGESLGLTQKQAYKVALQEFVEKHQKALRLKYLQELTWYKVSEREFVHWCKRDDKIIGKIVYIERNKTMKYMTAVLPKTTQELYEKLKQAQIDFSWNEDGLIYIMDGEEKVFETEVNSEKLFLLEYVLHYGEVSRKAHFTNDNTKEMKLMDWHVYAV